MQTATSQAGHLQQSMPNVAGQKNTITVKDQYGNVHEVPCNYNTLEYVRTVLGISNTSATAFQPTSNTPTFRFGIAHQPSIGSLPSAGSQYSSASSFSSFSTQGSGFGPISSRSVINKLIGKHENK